MKFPWTIIALMVFSTVSADNTSSLFEDRDNSGRWSAHTDEQIQNRIENIDLPFDTKYTSTVKKSIKSYVTNGYKGTEKILGRSFLYFPIFEHYLEAYNVPAELKYLSMIESRLRPSAESAVGASGLWQFMPSTARLYGLTINQYVDERHDPYKSSEAAAKMLASLYDQFGDWSLVLAAYNCGPGRVNKAIRLAGCKNYWDLSRFLPKETQNYVPRFIAASYVGEFYDFHELNPKAGTYKFNDIRAFRVYNYMTFDDIAYAIGMQPWDLEVLNPGYIAGVVPKSKKGNVVVIPANATELFQAYLQKKEKNHAPLVTVKGAFKSEHIVRPGDSLESLADLSNCAVKDIMIWNNLSTTSLLPNQILTLHLPKSTVFYRP